MGEKVSTLRRIEPISLLAVGTMPGIHPADIGGEANPSVIWIAPEHLLIDDEYQRQIAVLGRRLIRRIVANWSWRKFKPPVVTLTDKGYEVIDGQHTATAAASHPDIDTIPVMVVSTKDRADRADAFIAHNTDRVGVTSTQLHFSSVAAGDWAWPVGAGGGVGDLCRT